MYNIVESCGFTGREEMRGRWNRRLALACSGVVLLARQASISMQEKALLKNPFVDCKGFTALLASEAAIEFLIVPSIWLAARSTEALDAKRRTPPPVT